MSPWHAGPWCKPSPVDSASLNGPRDPRFLHSPMSSLFTFLYPSLADTCYFWRPSAYTFYSGSVAFFYTQLFGWQLSDYILLCVLYSPPCWSLTLPTGFWPSSGWLSRGKSNPGSLVYTADPHDNSQCFLQTRLLIFIWDPQNQSSQGFPSHSWENLSQPVCVVPAVVEPGDALPSGFSSHTINVGPFHSLPSARFVTFLCFVLVILLCRTAPSTVVHHCLTFSSARSWDGPYGENTRVRGAVSRHESRCCWPWVQH